MSSLVTRCTFILFFIGGFSSLLYEIVWLRQALVVFGATTPIVSVVTSAFMLGLALGAWLGGWWAEPLCRRFRLSPISLYALSEILVAVGSFAVPATFALAQKALLPLGSLDSLAYLSASTLALAVTIVPWTACMGAAFPLMVAYARSQADGGRVRGLFGTLYLANALGGLCAAFATAYVLIELNGLRGTLFVGTRLNIVAALVAALLARHWPGRLPEPPPAEAQLPLEQAPPLVRRPGLILFVTGFCSLAMQAVWTRLFTPIVGTTVYGFAYLLMLYLFGSWLGTWLYLRRPNRVLAASLEKGLLVLGALSITQAVFIDARLNLGVVGMALAVAPLCAALGYLTPLVIDLANHYVRREHGRHIGRSYGFNVAGCIFGPLVASYGLLPYMSERAAMLVLALPLIALVFRPGLRGATLGIATVALALLLAAPPAGPGRLLRDHTATVEARTEGTEKKLFVNSVEVASLSPREKVMALYPLALHTSGPVRSVLVIGLGTGTTFRSALSWSPDVDVTAVELVPSVPRMFDYFFDDARAVAGQARAHIVIDDARRFLRRSEALYDVIVVDPSPPLESASSSMLYSREFYELARSRLAPGGILHQWYPIGETRILQALVRSLLLSFKSVEGARAFDHSGVHFLASDTRIARLKGLEISARLTPSGRADLSEWLTGGLTADGVFQAMTARVLRPTALVSESERVVITDDHPYNEYFKVRRSIIDTDD